MILSDRPSAGVHLKNADLAGYGDPAYGLKITVSGHKTQLNSLDRPKGTK